MADHEPPDRNSVGQLSLFGRTGPAGDDEADYPYRFMSPWLQALVRADAEKRDVAEAV